MALRTRYLATQLLRGRWQRTLSSAVGAPIDLRSDTVTVPSDNMRAAMARAPVGDDVFGEDPTVNRLEEEGAAVLGKEACLFTPSGTMANLIGLAVHCQRGEGIICGGSAHIYNYEAGGLSVLTSAVMLTVPNDRDGSVPLHHVEATISPDDPHYVPARALALENTQNIHGGQVLKMDYVRHAKKLCDKHGLALHLDGARVGNAAAALDLPLAEVVEPYDSLTLCLSKGLGAPVGSLLAGPKDYIHKARRLRKMLGGGMRQAGVLGAAGLMALHSVDRLKDDHRRAQRLASGLADLSGLTMPCGVDTNLVLFEVNMDVDSFVFECEQLGLLLGGAKYSKGSIRAAVHNGITDEAVEEAIAIIRRVAQSGTDAVAAM